jgi:hypothetical protein
MTLSWLVGARLGVLPGGGKVKRSIRGLIRGFAKPLAMDADARGNRWLGPLAA